MVSRRRIGTDLLLTVVDSSLSRVQSFGYPSIYRVRNLAVFSPSSLRPSCSPLYSLGRAIAEGSILCRPILARLPLGYLRRIMSMQRRCRMLGLWAGERKARFAILEGLNKAYMRQIWLILAVALLCRLSAAPCILVSGSYRNGPSGFV